MQCLRCGVKVIILIHLVSGVSMMNPPIILILVGHQNIDYQNLQEGRYYHKWKAQQLNLRSTEIQVNGIGITDKEIKSLFDTVSNLLPSARDMSRPNTTVAAIKFRRRFMVKNDCAISSHHDETV